MSLFGNLGQTERKTGTLFGSTTAPAGGLFGQSQQTTAPQAATSLFGSTAAPQQQNTGLFGASSAPQQQNTGLFGASAAPQQQNTSLFGASAAPQQQNTGILGASQQQPQNTNSLFGQTQQPQQLQQSQQQQPNLNNSLFGGRLQPAPSLSAVQAQQMQQSQQGLPQLRQSANVPFASTSVNGQREKSVVEQMKTIHNKWDPKNPECSFQHYFYNSVSPDEAPFYGPAPYEDERKWEEALANKPSPGSIPVLARGFEEMAARINYQVLAVNGLRTRLHEINNSLVLMKDQHELNVASRITEARRKHIVHTQRTLALATKVQILRNRGYVMDQAEEELKKKLIEMEKRTFDPVLGGRQEEIWARMSGVRERAQMLERETEKVSNSIENQQKGEVLSEDDQKALEKLLKDYDKQLEHLKKWIDDTKQEYEEWEKEKQPTKLEVGRR